MITEEERRRRRDEFARTASTFATLFSLALCAAAAGYWLALVTRGLTEAQVREIFTAACRR